MIVAGIAFGKDSIGISVVEKVYPAQTFRKLFVERLTPTKGESDSDWFSRLFRWTSNVLRQHRPAVVLMEEATGSIRAVALAALSQFGAQNIVYTTASEGRRNFKKALGSPNPEIRVRRELHISYQLGRETLTACFFSVGRLATVTSERLKEEYLERDGRLKEIVHEG